MKGDKREPLDEVSFRLRMTEQQRATIEDRAKASGRSITAEIIHRVEDYDRMQRAYAVATTDPFVQMIAMKIAETAEFVDRLQRRDGVPQVIVRHQKRLKPTRCEHCNHSERNYETIEEDTLSDEDARKEHILEAARDVLRRYTLDGKRRNKDEVTGVVLKNSDAFYASQEVSRAMQPILDQIATCEDLRDMYQDLADSAKDTPRSEGMDRYIKVNLDAAARYAERVENLRAQLPDLDPAKPAQESTSALKRPKPQRKPTG